MARLIIRRGTTVTYDSLNSYGGIPVDAVVTTTSGQTKSYPALAGMTLEVFMVTNNSRNSGLNGSVSITYPGGIPTVYYPPKYAAANPAPIVYIFGK